MRRAALDGLRRAAATLNGLLEQADPLTEGRPESGPGRALEVNDLVKRYPTGVEALRGVSLEIEEGEFFGLLGPNGAGKSTLIHCATGLAQPTSGSIRVFGHDAMEDYAEARAWRSGSRRRSSTSTGS